MELSDALEREKAALLRSERKKNPRWRGLGELLAMAREAAGLSPGETGRYLFESGLYPDRLSVRRLSDYERGASLVTPDLLFSLLSLYATTGEDRPELSPVKGRTCRSFADPASLARNFRAHDRFVILLTRVAGVMNRSSVAISMEAEEKRRKELAEEGRQSIDGVVIQKAPGQSALPAAFERAREKTARAKGVLQSRIRGGPDLDEALKLLNEALAGYPTYVDALYLRATVHLKIRSRRLASIARSASTEEAERERNRGSLDRASAYRDAERVTQLDPRHAGAAGCLARLKKEIANEKRPRV